MNNDKIDDVIPGQIYFNKYKIKDKLGEGSFGKIFTATNETNNQLLAMKFEKREQGKTMLETEAFFMSYLKGFGIPRILSYGFVGNYNILVMELVGKSLEQIFQAQHKKFSIKTTCMLAIQMIDLMQVIHEKDLIHRDVKPDNFCVGLGERASVVYILDFGLAMKYRVGDKKEHIPMELNKKLTGTTRYSSVSAMKGFEQSRRDDMEALGYIFMYFLKSELPWQGLYVQRRVERYKKIMEKKESTTPEELCAGFPEEFAKYITYTRNLKFEGNPDYGFLKGLFVKVLADQKETLDNKYDWSPSVPEKTLEVIKAEIIEEVEKNIFDMSHVKNDIINEVIQPPMQPQTQTQPQAQEQNANNSNKNTKEEGKHNEKDNKDHTNAPKKKKKCIIF